MSALQLIISLCIIFILPILSCTNLLITPGASASNTTMLAYNADSGNLMGYLYHYPASSNNDVDKTRKVYDWDSGKYLGNIPEANNTYNVVGNTNEFGLTIAETTFGGIDTGIQKDAILDYGSLIYITLQRSKTVQEAIITMSNLMDLYGYVSEGESFSIADSKEIWIMEVIGKGSHGKGAVWVAMKVPDGMISAHSNQARITTFPRNLPKECVYSHDVIDFAKNVLGIYQSPKDDPEDLMFSFSDVYHPVSFSGARFSEARTWAMFSMLSEDAKFMETYHDYAAGRNLKHRMPLFITPKRLLTYQDISLAMASHYEESPLEFNSDVGAGAYNAPYRARPLTWWHKDKQYFNERAVATQQTGWSFIAEIRSNFPNQCSSVLWFSVDDSSTSPKFPVYGCSARISDAYSGLGTQDGVSAPLLDFDLNKAFWVQNMVSNFAYSRWKDVYPILRQEIDSLHERFRYDLSFVDQQLLALYDEDYRQEMINVATEFSVHSGDNLHRHWLQFYGKLFARFRDFYEIEEDPSNEACKCKVKEENYSDSWKERIINETGDNYEYLDDPELPVFMKLNFLRGSNSR